MLTNKWGTEIEDGEHWSKEYSLPLWIFCWTRAWCVNMYASPSLNKMLLSMLETTSKKVIRIAKCWARSFEKVSNSPNAHIDKMLLHSAILRATFDVLTLKCIGILRSRRTEQTTANENLQWWSQPKKYIRVKKKKNDGFYLAFVCIMQTVWSYKLNWKFYPQYANSYSQITRKVFLLIAK